MIYRALKNSVLLLVLSIFISGCSSTLKKMIQKPTVKLDSVGVRDVNERGTTVLFGIKVQNPNGFALKLNSLEYDLEVGGKPITKGELDEKVEIAAKSETIVHLPVSLKFSDVFQSLTDVFLNGKSPYRLKGRANVSSVSVPFDHSGELKFK